MRSEWRHRCGHLQAIRSECAPDADKSDADNAARKLASGILLSSWYLLGVFLVSA